MTTEHRAIAALWAYDKTDRYPPQFVAAVAESLRDAFWEESERLRALAEQWFVDFGEDGDANPNWTFQVAYTQIPVQDYQPWLETTR